MGKWIISYNIGYGDMYEEIEAASEDDANEAAYDAWREASEQDARYEAVPWTQELADDVL